MVHCTKSAKNKVHFFSLKKVDKKLIGRKGHNQTNLSIPISNFMKSSMKGSKKRLLHILKQYMKKCFPFPLFRFYVFFMLKDLARCFIYFFLLCILKSQLIFPYKNFVLSYANLLQFSNDHCFELHLSC